jgi:hypothetical protein
MTAYYSPDQTRKLMSATMAHEIQQSGSPPDMGAHKEVKSNKYAEELKAVTKPQKGRFIPIAINKREHNNTPVGGHTNNEPKLHDYELKMVYIIDKLAAFKLANREKCVNIGESTFVNVKNVKNVKNINQ